MIRPTPGKCDLAAAGESPRFCGARRDRPIPSADTNRIVLIVQIFLIALALPPVSCTSAHPVVLKTALAAPVSPPAGSPPPVERHTVFLLKAPFEPRESLWEPTADHLATRTADRAADSGDCRSWNDEGVYRLLLASRGRQISPRQALPLFDRARLLCPKDPYIEANFRTAFVLRDTSRPESP